MNAPHDRTRSFRHIDSINVAIAIGAVATPTLTRIWEVGFGWQKAARFARFVLDRHRIIFALAEIAQNRPAQALGRHAVVSHRGQAPTLRCAHNLLFLVRQRFVARLLLDEKPAGRNIGIVPQQQTVRWLAIATRTTCFLVVRLQAARHVEMHHIAHV